jgi:hypothetical protein
VETKRDVSSVVRNISSAKEVVPKAEREAVVHAVTVLGWQVTSMVPDVHLRIVEKILQGTKRETKVGVIEVTDYGGEEVHNDEVINAKADEGEGKVFQDLVNHVFHPVIAEVSGEAHFFDRVVHFVKFPKPRNAVEEAVHVPMDEIPHYEKSEKLGPHCPARNLDGHQIGNAYHP